VAKASSLIATGFLDLRSNTIDSGDRTVFGSAEAYPVIGFMPACDPDFFCAKVACVSYENPRMGVDSHQGAVLLFERPTGMLRAVIDATALTAVRTAAVTHVALGRLFSPERKIKRAAIVGAGVQAFHHIRMLSSSFGISEFVLVSRSKERVASLKEQFGGDLTIEHRSYGCALHDCAVVVLATHGDEVCLALSQVGANTVIIGLGSCRPCAQEIASDILDRCLFIADSFQACARSSGEGQYIARKENANYLEMADLIGGSDQCKERSLTVVKTVGLGFEDLVCAKYLYQAASTQPGVTQLLEFGGARAY
jgi:ornithine cyclodeaminase